MAWAYLGGGYALLTPVTVAMMMHIGFIIILHLSWGWGLPNTDFDVLVCWGWGCLPQLPFWYPNPNPTSFCGTPTSFCGTPTSFFGTPTSFFGTPTSFFGTPTSFLVPQLPFLVGVGVGVVLPQPTTEILNDEWKWGWMDGMWLID
jgi:hypothetical protein